MERTLKLSMTFKIKTGDLEEKPSDSVEKQKIKSFLKVFLDTPGSVANYHKAILAYDLEALNDTEVPMWDYLDVAGTADDIILSAAEKCPDDIKTFIKNIFTRFPPNKDPMDECDRETYRSIIEYLLGKLEIIGAEFIDITGLPGSSNPDEATK